MESIDAISKHLYFRAITEIEIPSPGTLQPGGEQGSESKAYCVESSWTQSAGITHDVACQRRLCWEALVSLRKSRGQQ